jgi:periplasmic protein TonB
MTAATAGPQRPNLFSMFACDRDHLYGARRDTFILSLLGQAIVLGVLIYFTSCVIRGGPEITRHLPNLNDLPLVFSGHNGGGGSGFDKSPASHGNPPRATLDEQIVPPTVIVPKEMPKLPKEETVMVAPNVKLPLGGQIGDPMSQLTRVLSDGPGGRGGMGNGCCGGIGDWTGPYLGSGPPGVFPPGKFGVTVPQAIYTPEPNFSDEARKAKQQGAVILLLVVGQDGHTYNIRVGQSLGMGLDEKAIEAVSRWRFKPATLNGQPVATQIAVEVDFRLY